MAGNDKTRNVFLSKDKGWRATIKSAIEEREVTLRGTTSLLNFIETKTPVAVFAVGVFCEVFPFQLL